MHLRGLPVADERLSDGVLSGFVDDSEDPGVSLAAGVGVVVVAPIVISVTIVWPNSLIEVIRDVTAVAPWRGYSG